MKKLKGCFISLQILLFWGLMMLPEGIGQANHSLSLSPSIGFSDIVYNYRNDVTQKNIDDTELSINTGLQINYRYKNLIISGMYIQSRGIGDYREPVIWSAESLALLGGYRYTNKKYWLSGEILAGAGNTNYRKKSYQQNHAPDLEFGTELMVKTGLYISNSPRFCLGPYFIFSKGPNYTSAVFMLTLELGFGF